MFVVSSTSLFSYIWADKTLDSLLNVLDLTIQEHETYVAQRESRIKHLKELTQGIEVNSVERYNLNSQIYKEYKAFICDSAIHYLNENVRIADRLHDTDRKIESQLQLSLLLSSTGMYTESIDVLESVDRQKVISRLITDYYTCFDHVYGELSVYTQDKTLSGYYWSISQAYRDSLYTILPPESEEYLMMREASLRVSVMALKDGKPAKLQDDGTGAIWAIGKGIGKPSVTSSEVGWEPSKALCLAQVAPKVSANLESRGNAED